MSNSPSNGSNSAINSSLSSSTSADIDFVFEQFTEYYGDSQQVKKQIHECKMCGSKLSFAHLSDYKNMIVQESTRCPQCGHKMARKIHIIN